jgi:cytochrome b
MCLADRYLRLLINVCRQNGISEWNVATFFLLPQESTMPRVLIWDLPTRIFHWLLTIGFFISAAISVMADEDSSLFSGHMILGIVLVVMVLLRIVWGFVGTRYARFTSFLFSPMALMRYGFGALSGTEARSIGHNAGSSYAIYTMLGLVIAAAVTGLMISRGNEAAEELHEVASYLLMAVVCCHLIGVAWYSLRHKENITLSMLTGRKEASAEDSIPSSRPIVGILFLLFVGFLTIRMFQNHDRTTGMTTLPWLGIEIPLGESESSDGGGHHDD